MFGALEIEIIDNKGEKFVKLNSPKMLNRSNALIGKTPNEAIKIIGILFNLCPIAHINCAKLAMGQDLDNGYQNAIIKEIIFEHAMLCFIEIPKILGIECKNENLLGLSNLDNSRIDKLAIDLFGKPIEEIIEHFHENQLGGFSQILLGEINEWNEEFGAVNVENDASFFARHQRFGYLNFDFTIPSLKTRLMVRFWEMINLLNMLKNNEFTTICGKFHNHEAWVWAARGQLKYLIEIENNIIKKCQIKTPTNLMIEENGLLERILNSALKAPNEYREKVFKFGLLSADPCIETKIIGLI